MSGEFMENKEYILLDIKERLVRVQEEVNTKPSLTAEDSEEFSLYNYVEDKQGFNLVCDTAKFYIDMAYVLTHRLNYFLLGDDGEENFRLRLAEDVDSVMQQHKELVEGI